MVTVVTGAAGFVGRALVARLERTGGDRESGEIRLVDRVLPDVPPGFTAMQVDLTDPAALERAFSGATRVIHLAALPGGASEADPDRSRAINLEVSLNIIDLLSRDPNRPTLVYASSIAVFGAPLPEFVDDASPPRPSMTYGTHKLMVELAVADAARRGVLRGIALRLPGIVARPSGPSGLKSAFMSDVFRAIRDEQAYILPVSPESTVWIISATAAADALVHGLDVEMHASVPNAVTLPALRVTMSELVTAIAAATGRDAAYVTYRPDEALIQQFARLPPLATPAAAALGFTHDGTLDRLVERVLATLPI